MSLSRALCRIPRPRLYVHPKRLVRAFSTHPANLPDIPLFRALRQHDPSSTAVVHSASARRFPYGDVVRDVLVSREGLRAGSAGTEGRRVAFLVENSYDYVGMACPVLSSQLHS